MINSSNLNFQTTTNNEIFPLAILTMNGMWLSSFGAGYVRRLRQGMPGLRPHKIVLCKMGNKLGTAPPRPCYIRNFMQHSGVYASLRLPKQKSRQPLTLVDGGCWLVRVGYRLEEVRCLW